MYYTFLETSGKFWFNGDGPNHQDPNQEPQEPQEDQGCPAITGRFLTTIFHLKCQVLHSFENLRQNPVE